MVNALPLGNNLLDGIFNANALVQTEHQLKYLVYRYYLAAM